MDALSLIDKSYNLGAEVVQIADNLPVHLLDGHELDKIRDRAAEKDILLEVGTAGLGEENLLRAFSLLPRGISWIIESWLSWQGDIAATLSLEE